MKKYIHKMLLCFSLIGLALFTGCKKKFFDINQNTNSPEKVEIKDVLPSAEIAIAYVVGNDFQVYGSLWSQYWTQNPSSSQYKTIDQYAPKADDFDHPWRILYADALEDLRFVELNGIKDGKPQYVAISKILQAYTYQLLTDNFGDIPFTEALKGTDGNFTPAYDPQQKVYDGIIALLDNATSLINVDDPAHPGNDDIYFHGDMALWEKFANTLKLKVYLRLSEVDPTRAQTGIQGLSGKAFLDVGEDVRVTYTSTGGNTNPLYSTIVDLNLTQNLVGSATSVDTMFKLNDDRLTKLFDPATATGAYVGVIQGDYDAGTALSSIALPSVLTGASANKEESATAPVKLMSDYESLFLQAEAAARGWLSGSDEDLYYQGIAASFTALSLNEAEDDSVAITYYNQAPIAYPTAGDLQAKVKAIITQKWFSMVGTQGIEAWAEYRRTGYPDFFTPSKVSIIGSDRTPARMFYPSTELTRNPKTPAQKRIFERVWWDVQDNIMK